VVDVIVQPGKSADALEELRDLATQLLNRVATLQAGPLPLPQLVTLEKAAEMLAIGRTLAQELVDSGTLPVVEVTGRAVRVDVRDIEVFIKTTRRRR
jgi:excisionase family DNA binding protein